MNDISILVLKTKESNPSSLKAELTLQDNPRPAKPISHGLKLLNHPANHQPATENSLNTANLPSANTGVLKPNCKPKSTSYSETCQSPKDNSPNGHQIDANLEPPQIWTYSEVLTCLKEVKAKPIINSANDHQQLPAFHPEWVVQLNCSGDIVNCGGGMKHCHFCSPEQAQPGSATLGTLSQDPHPASALPANLNPAKIEEAKHHVIFHLNSGQADYQATTPSRDQPANSPQALYCPPGAPFGPVHFTEYPPNPAYSEYNLETIFIADPLARTISTDYVGRKGKRIEIPPLLFKGSTTTYQRTSVRNIPDNTVAQNNSLCTINCKKQNKKWQQFPLIGETAAGSQGQKIQIKNKVFNWTGFIPVCGLRGWLPAVRTPNRQAPAEPGGLPARACCQPVPHPGCQMGKLTKGETQKGNFPKPKWRGNCCPNLESTKFGGG
ncbi:hypothetical protein DSO57_1008329 [Entomophthora muscae]|uniref:Uncharacterized protein n=1 Tax=Entomophthora muscae TaxID=34485 RepID=A0ACC2RM07_9FUNG|nr:hypothetical protein DSO57_1008329 [Entomophthora muscae]